MSYYDDWIAPNMFDVESYLQEIREAENNRHIGWTTKDGDLIPYSEMTTSHLINCRKMIIRKDIRKSFLPYIDSELKRRGCYSALK